MNAIMMNQQRKKRSLSRWFKRRSKYNFVQSVDDASECDHFRSASAMSGCWSDGRESPTTADFHLKLSEFEEQIKQLKTENDRLRHQMMGLEDESADLTVERNELQAQLDIQKDLLERKLSVTKRDVEEINGQLSVIDSSKDMLEREIKSLRKEKRDLDSQLKETNEKMCAYEARIKASEQIQTNLSDKVKKMWLLKEKETNERKVLLSLLKSAESFAKSQEEVILELLYKIKELKREIIDKDVELAGLRQKCISVDRIDFLDREIEIDVSFDYNKNELSFDEFDLDVGSSAFSPVDSSSFLITAARLSTQQQLQQRQQLNSTPHSPIATTLLDEDTRSSKNVPSENQLHQSSKFWNEVYVSTTCTIHCKFVLANRFLLLSCNFLLHLLLSFVFFHLLWCLCFMFCDVLAIAEFERVLYANYMVVKA